jgi:hypothetical protein
VHLQLPDSNEVAARLPAQPRSSLDGPAQRAGDDDTAALRREDPIDREPMRPPGASRAARRGHCGGRVANGRRRVAFGPHHAIANRPERRTERIDPVARRRRGSQDGRALERRSAQQRPRLLDDGGNPLGVDQVRLRHDREPGLDPERVEELEMLERLRPRAVIRGHHEHRRIDLARPDEHVADQPVVARNVDEVELDPVVEGQVRVADVDRHAPGTFLGQTIGIDAGQRSQEAGLAVVDVTGGPDDDGSHTDQARGRRLDASMAVATASTSFPSSAGSTVRRSSTTASSTIRAMTAGVPPRRAEMSRSGAGPWTMSARDSSV